MRSSEDSERIAVRALSVLIGAALALCPARLAAQPIPPEFLVNETIVGEQHGPVVDRNQVGDFIVGWTSGHMPGSTTMHARAFTGAGAPLGGEIILPEPANPNYPWPRVTGIALGPQGSFAVVWTSSLIGSIAYSSAVRLFSSDGNPLSDELDIGGVGTGWDISGDVAMDGTGAFVVAAPRQVGWAPVGYGVPLTDVFFQRFAADGSLIGEPGPVGDMRMEELSAEISASATGAFVVAWAGSDFSDGPGVYVRSYDSDADPIGPVQTVATNASGVDVAMASDGSFVVVYSTDAGILAQRYDASSSPLGPAFRVDDTMPGGGPAVCVDPADRITIAWTSGGDVVERRYDALGGPLRGPYRVNVQTTGTQSSPAVAGLSGVGFVAVWESEGQDGDGLGIIGRLFPASVVAVQVEELEASATADWIHLTWRLSSDAPSQILGVRVQRADAAAGPYRERTAAHLDPASAMSFEESDFAPGHTYWYRLTLIEPNGTTTHSRPVHITAARASQARSDLRVAADAGGGTPVEIRYWIAGATTAVDVAIYDVAGRRVRSIYAGVREAGEYVHSWDRRDSAGERAPRGVYFVRLGAGDRRLCERFSLVRK